MRTFTIEEPLLGLNCILGEGPVYDTSNGILHFVDIETNEVHHYNTYTATLTTDTYKESITCIALRLSDEGLACTTTRGFAILKPESEIAYLDTPTPFFSGRFNDGACDAEGRFFAGTVRSLEYGTPGQLYCYDPFTRECIVVDEGPFTDSNGIGWSPDGKTMYFTDSLNNLIYKYNFNQGRLSNRTVFVDTVKMGYPEDTYCDGLCVDTKGGVWSARWAGSKIVRFTADGTPDVEILLPKVYHATSCVFGGPENDKMYITTAHPKACDGDGTLQEQYPQSGLDLLAELETTGLVIEIVVSKNIHQPVEGVSVCDHAVRGYGVRKMLRE